jgi:hypothetical protein
LALLSEEEKQEIRDSLVEPGEEILAETATILRATNVADGRGGTSQTYLAQPATASCMLAKATASAAASADRPFGGTAGPIQLWQISFLDLADVRKTDRIQIGTRIFEVDSDTALGTYTLLNRVIAREVFA